MDSNEELLLRILDASLTVLYKASNYGVPVYARKLARTSLLIEGPLGKTVAKPAILKDINNNQLVSFGLADVKNREPVSLGIINTTDNTLRTIFIENVATLMSISGIIPWQRADVWLHRLENSGKLVEIAGDQCCMVLGIPGRRCIAIRHNILNGIVAWYNGDIGVLEINAKWIAKWKKLNPKKLEEEILNWLNTELPKLAVAKTT